MAYMNRIWIVNLFLLFSYYLILCLSWAIIALRSFSSFNILFNFRSNNSYKKWEYLGLFTGLARIIKFYVNYDILTYIFKYKAFYVIFLYYYLCNTYIYISYLGVLHFFSFVKIYIVLLPSVNSLRPLFITISTSFLLFLLENPFGVYFMVIFKCMNCLRQHLIKNFLAGNTYQKLYLLAWE